MTQVILYKNDVGNVATIIPTQEYINLIGIDAIAHKDVPSGRPYRVIDASEIPPDIAHLSHMFAVSDTDLNGGIGHDYGVGTLWDVIGYGEGTAFVKNRTTGQTKEVPL